MPRFAGFVYNSSGVAANGATVNLYDLNTTTPVRATTTSNTSGYWAINHATDGQFDIEVVNASTTRRIKYNNEVTFLRMETRQLRLDGSTSGRISMAAPATVTDYTITWPAAAPGSTTGLRMSSAGTITADASSAGITREGGQTTEATTTSTTAVDLLTASGLTIAAATPFKATGVMRKTAGAAAAVGTGWKLNTTVTGTAATGGARPWRSDATNEAQNGAWLLTIGARVTNYGRPVSAGEFTLHSTAGGTILNTETTCGNNADVPTAEITDVIVQGISGDAAVTEGADEMHVYELATS